MIRVTRLDRQEIALNCDLIESVEARPDTTIRLVTGPSLVVRETVDEVLERVRDWRASVLQQAGLAGALVQRVTPVLLHARGAPSAPSGSADERGDELLEFPA